MKGKIKKGLFFIAILLIVIVTAFVLFTMDVDTSRDDVYKRIAEKSQERIP